VIRGRDFLKVDAFLENRHEDEFVRTRIGRLYYAAYLEARGFCEVSLAYVRTRQGREHQDIRRLLSAVDPNLSASIRFLRNLRNAADYDLDLSSETIRLNLADALTLSHGIIARLDELTETTAPR
jgi:hypothetical protein